MINKYYNKEKDKFEKRLLEEFNKIFTETDSFYFCATTDITNSLQRRSIAEQNEQYKDLPLWRKVDDRFFWNKHMLKDLIDINVSFSFRFSFSFISYCVINISIYFCFFRRLIAGYCL